MKIEDIARLCHEANRVYCDMIGDPTQEAWPLAEQWQRDSAVNGVRFHIENPDAGPPGSHENWMKEKAAAGWKYGAVKDPSAKEHPCMVPYEQLPAEQRAKDSIFVGIVHALKHLVE